jgi:hypothetical protein
MNLEHSEQEELAATQSKGPQLAPLNNTNFTIISFRLSVYICSFISNMIMIKPDIIDVWKPSTIHALFQYWVEGMRWTC